MSNRAWVTLATNDSYGLGALVLAHSLRRTGSAYPVVVLITPAVSDAMRERLNGVFAEVITVDVLDSRDEAHLALLRRPELGITFTKIHCWSLLQYEKCVFLDADTLVIQNSDELFEREELSAAPDIGWPDCFNSGVFVFKPSKETFDSIIAFAQERGSFDGGDQGLLNSYFSDWAHTDIKKHLPFLYNVTSVAFYSYLPAFKHFRKDVKILHFIGPEKPWLHRYNWESGTVDCSDHLKDVLRMWWSIFVDSVHSHLNTDMVEDHTTQEVELPLDPLDELIKPSYYEPPIDSSSEFPWHHSEPQNPQQTDESYNLDLTQFHDPWSHYYKGNIPIKTDEFPENSGRTEMTQELREYIFDYKEKHSSNKNHTGQEQFHWHHQPEVENFNVQVSHSHYHPHSSQQEQHHHSDHYSNVSNHDWDVESHSHHNNDNAHHHSHHNHDHCHHQSERLHDSNEHHNNNQVNNHNHSSHYDNAPQSHFHGEHHHKLDCVINQEENRDYHQHHDEHGQNHQNDDLLHNGDISKSDDDEERTRHPYDGFYLRHRITVDPRGRKICTHELPSSPPPSPPPSLPEPLAPILENHETDSIQTGVAGNLARIVPNAPASTTQQGAIDELTRRQGWESGNMDYMGVDSFDNIWAKISQTLNQAPVKQPSPPRQKSPPKTVDTTDSIAAETKPENVSQAVVEPEAPAPSEEKVTPSEPVIIEQDIIQESEAVTLESQSTETENETKTSEEVPSASIETPPSSESSKPVEENTLVELISEVKIIDLVAEPGQKDVIEAVIEEISVQVVKSEVPENELPASVVEPVQKEEPNLPAVVDEAPFCPAVPVAEAVATPEKTLDLSPSAAESSPPLANTPSKEERSILRKKSKSPEKADGEHRRKRAVGKLQLLRPVPSPEPLLTPDSELEDAASLAQRIIASELATPTVTAPTPPVVVATPSPAALPKLTTTDSLDIDAPNLDTPPAGPVSLSQIGVKPKPTTAAQIVSSLADAKPTDLDCNQPETPAVAPPKKKVIKKVVKKVPAAAAAGAGEAPVPPPRKKEKKPKDK